jgi:hypothetical protein
MAFEVQAGQSTSELHLKMLQPLTASLRSVAPDDISTEKEY